MLKITVKTFPPICLKIDIKEGSQNIDIEGKSFLLSLTHLPSQNWFVGALIDNEKAFATVDNLRNSAIIYNHYRCDSKYYHFDCSD